MNTSRRRLPGQHVGHDEAGHQHGDADHEIQHRGDHAAQERIGAERSEVDGGQVHSNLLRGCV
jgi:hypothetical protein